MNYVRFLKHHAPIPELIGIVDETNKTILPNISEKSPRISSNRTILNQLSIKLRRKVFLFEKKNLMFFKINILVI